MQICVDSNTTEADSPRDIRNAYLHLLEPTKEKADKADRKNSPEHALARAAAFLPAQYAVTRNVMAELNSRLGGGLTGPILEASGTIGPGLWAAVETAGPDVASEYALVHRTRHGLALAERFAQPIDQPMQFKRDIVEVELLSTPQVALSSFVLTTLPKPNNRQTHLRQLLSFNADHLVVLERAGKESWEVMKEARKFILSQSTDENPLHITAPCPHEEGCPRTEGKEACMFVQRVQRPGFVRKTKHGKRGEEDMSYTYLIVSRGKRPQADASSVGRMGAVAKEHITNLIAKSEGFTELHEVEGGDGFEMLSLNTNDIQIESTGGPQEEVDEQLRAEAYSWPRLLAPVMKRSGHVVMDACTAEGNVQRWRVAKSHGKQEYYDARKLNWGDLYPHAIMGKTEIRDRGVRRLAKEQVEVIDDFSAFYAGLEENATEDKKPQPPPKDPLIAALEEVELGDGFDSPEVVANAKAAKTKRKAKATRAQTEAEAEAAAEAEADAVETNAKPLPVGFFELSPAGKKALEENNARCDELLSTDASWRKFVLELPQDMIDQMYPEGLPPFKGTDEEFENAIPVHKQWQESVRKSRRGRSHKNRRLFSTSAVARKPEDDVDEDCAVGEGGFSPHSLGEPRFREGPDDIAEDIDEDCAVGEGGFSRSSLSDPDDTRPMSNVAYHSPRPTRPTGPISKDKDADAASSLEGGFSASSLSDPKFRNVEEVDEDVDEDYAMGEGGFSRSSLSDPDYERAKGAASYESPRPSRPTEPITASTDFRAATMKRPWTSALADPPMRTNDSPATAPGRTPVSKVDLEEVDEECAFGDGEFSRSSLSDPDYDPPTGTSYKSPRPTRPDGPIHKDEDADAASSGEGSFSRSSFSDPPVRGSSSSSSSQQKRGFSTLQKRGFATSARVMSVRPADLSGRAKVNVGELHAMHKAGTPITVLTCYDYPTALLISRANVDVALVGDSLSQVVLGHDSTTQLTLEEMAHHVRAVARGARHAFIIADMPFGYANASVNDGVRAAVHLIKAGADGIKIEGGKEMLPLIRRLAETGVPVMPHIGLQPQRAAATGYKAQARSALAAVELLDTAKQCEEAGGFGLLLEAIPHQIGKMITERSGIPTIGIGAGNATSGQVLVLTDLLGTYDQQQDDNCSHPRFVRQMGNAGRESRRAVDEYVTEVRARSFPATGKETYGMPKLELDELNNIVNTESPVPTTP